MDEQALIAVINKEFDRVQEREDETTSSIRDINKKALLNPAYKAVQTFKSGRQYYSIRRCYMSVFVRA